MENAAKEVSASDGLAVGFGWRLGSLEAWRLGSMEAGIPCGRLVAVLWPSFVNECPVFGVRRKLTSSNIA